MLGDMIKNELRLFKD
jgi:hypothetical protein